MAITNRLPAPNWTLEPGDSFAFTIDDTYTSLVIKIQTAAALETAYTTAGGGAQSGYTVAVTDNGDGTHTLVTSRDSGWDTDPLQVTVTENESGSSVTTTWEYDLFPTTAYPDGMQPYNSAVDGRLVVQEASVTVRSDVKYLNFDTATFNVTDAGDGKVTVTGIAAGTGDVVGPAGATEHAVVLFDGTSGKLIKAIGGLGASGQVLTSNGAGAAPTMQTVTGTGDVVGPASSTDSVLAEFSGTTGKLLKDGTVTAAQVTANTAKVTNATHTGDVTGATALTISAGAVDIAMLANGTDGELITWDAAGAPATVPVGTATHVLTSNGAGAAPTFQAPTGGGDVSGPAGGTVDGDLVIYDDTTGKLLRAPASGVTEAAVQANTAKVTNATHTGDVTGSTALTIAAKAVDVAMLADGTDGELLTWDASGVAATVAAGTATHVLTSNGAGAAPTFQAAAGGSGANIAGIEWLWASGGGAPSTGDFTTVGGPNKNAVSSFKFHETSDTPSSVLYGTDFLGQFSVGDLIVLQLVSSPGTDTAIYRVSAAPTLAANVWTVPVSYLHQSGATSFSAVNYTAQRQGAAARATEASSASGTITSATYGLWASGTSVITTLTPGKYFVHVNTDMIHSSASATTDFRLGTYNSIFTVFTPATNPVRTIINDSTTERQSVHVSGIVDVTLSSPNLACQGRTTTATATLGNVSFVALSVG